MRLMTFLIICLILSGCATNNSIDPVIDHYNISKSQIIIGMDLNDFLAIFEPHQRQLEKSASKPSERFTKNGALYDVYYIRSGRIPDGETTDDEFTPYIFIDGKLAEIGWLAIGGMKRTSQDVAREKAEIEKAKASAVKIEQKFEQKTDIKK